MQSLVAKKPALEILLDVMPGLSSVPTQIRSRRHPRRRTNPPRASTLLRTNHGFSGKEGHLGIVGHHRNGTAIERQMSWHGAAVASVNGRSRIKLDGVAKGIPNGAAQ